MQPQQLDPYFGPQNTELPFHPKRYTQQQKDFIKHFTIADLTFALRVTTTCGFVDEIAKFVLENKHLVLFRVVLIITLSKGNLQKAS